MERNRGMMLAAGAMLMGGLGLSGYNLVAGGALTPLSWAAGLLILLGVAAVVATVTVLRPAPATDK